MTPRRTVAVGLLTLAAVSVTSYAALAISGNGQSYSHPLWHLLWGVLTVPIALGILFVRRAWPATGWTERSLVAAVVFALTSAAGNILAGIGVLPEYEASSLYGHPLWQFSWAGPTVAIALGIFLVRRAWPATVLARRWLVVALAFALVCAAGNVLIGIGVLPYYLPPTKRGGSTGTWSRSQH